MKMKVMFVLLLAVGMMACTQQKVEVKYYDSDNNFRGTSRLDSVVKKDTVIQFWYKGEKSEWHIKPK